MAKGVELPDGMLQQLQQMQEQLLSAQTELAEETVTSTSGGGAVKITLTGDQRCTAIEIDSAVLQDGDVEMLQDLLMTALNQALEDSREMAAKRLGPLAGGISI
ncbi:MAG: YbaB/EbfC family nucleoid-associated protein [Chloroflexi bacterium]|nr:YbaB/EbfC family nucleoid-associated protein [Chloroflexota bacterium]